LSRANFQRASGTGVFGFLSGIGSANRSGPWETLSYGNRRFSNTTPGATIGPFNVRPGFHVTQTIRNILSAGDPGDFRHHPCYGKAV